MRFGSARDTSSTANTGAKAKDVGLKLLIKCLLRFREGEGLKEECERQTGFPAECQGEGSALQSPADYFPRVCVPACSRHPLDGAGRSSPCLRSPAGLQARAGRCRAPGGGRTKGPCPGTGLVQAFLPIRSHGDAGDVPAPSGGPNKGDVNEAKEGKQGRGDPKSCPRPRARVGARSHAGTSPGSGPSPPPAIPPFPSEVPEEERPRRRR